MTIEEIDEPVGGEEPADSEGADRRVFRIRSEIRKRLDSYLQGRLKAISRTRVQKLIDLGGVTVNGKPPKASTTIKFGDVIKVILPAPAIRTIEPEAIPLDVLYEDPYFIVINKQADLIVHPARGKLTGTLVNALAHHFKEQQEHAGRAWKKWETRGFRQKGRRSRQEDGEVDGLSTVGAEDYRPGIVHRLDKNTTGVMVVAKSDVAHWQIARQFEDRKPVKAYLAVVHGNFDEPAGVIEESIGKHPTIREAYAVRHDSSGRKAVTIYRVREQYAGYALVELELKTGRTHQIRVHLTYLGHPIVGDVMYGGEVVSERELASPPVPAGARKFLNFARERDEGVKMETAAAARAATGEWMMAQPALHAAFLRFTHPIERKAVTFTAPVHRPMARLIEELRKRRVDKPVADRGWWVDLDKALHPP